MNRILLLTSRNIDKNGGERALIFGRHSALYHIMGIETDIAFFHKDTPAITCDAQSGLHFLKCSKQNLFLDIDRIIFEGSYNCVVLSGQYNRVLINYINSLKPKYNYKLILDIHATIREIYEYCKRDFKHMLGTRVLYLRDKRNFKFALDSADGAFIVSNVELEEISALTDVLGNSNDKNWVSQTGIFVSLIPVQRISGRCFMRRLRYLKKWLILTPMLNSLFILLSVKKRKVS